MDDYGVTSNSTAMQAITVSTEIPRVPIISDCPTVHAFGFGCSNPKQKIQINTQVAQAVSSTKL